MTRYAIQYQYPGTVNGEAVGLVYAQDIGRLSPGCWSYTKTPSEATLFADYNSAFTERGKHGWPDSSVVAVEAA